MNLQVNSRDANSAYFWVVPIRLGQIPIEVSVVYRNAGDAVRRLLLVEVNMLVESCRNGNCSIRCRLSSKRVIGKRKKTFIFSVCC